MRYNKEQSKINKKFGLAQTKKSLSAYSAHTLTRIFADKMIIIRPKYKKNVKKIFVPRLLTQIEFIGVKKWGSKISHLGPFKGTLT
jgi:hypothetical protein